MSWGQEYADLHHSHREIDEERYDRERAIDDARSYLHSRIDDARTDCNAAREELWTEIHELRGKLDELANVLYDHRTKAGSHGS
jgi:chromosome segregation ATPase